MNVAVIIPVGPGHESVAERAVACAQAQTVPVQVIRVDDSDKRGPAWARNEGARLASPEIEHLIFLDADDEIAPRFAQACLAVARPNTYVYTDWYMGKRRQHARPAGSLYCFCPRPISTAEGEHFHPVTTLIPREWFERVGGFDEELTKGGEDRALYTALNMLGCCGMPLHEPLFRYNYSANSRGARWVGDDANSRWLHARLVKQFEGIISMCRSCGSTKAVTRPGANMRAARQVPDVYGAPGESIDFRAVGNRRVVVSFNCRAQFRRTIPSSPTGKATGFNYARHYGARLVFPNMIWMDVRDAQAEPGAWAIIETVGLPEELVGALSVEEIGQVLFGNGGGAVARPKFGKKPDYKLVIEVGQHGMKSGGVFR